jgi:hypothetical protein
VDLILQVVTLAYVVTGTWLACDTMDACATNDPKFSKFENFIVQYIMVLLVVVGWGIVFFWVFFREKK